MSRIKEKIKDLIEVHPYKSLQDFTAEPSETLASYHFTAITSELMSNWLEALVNVQNQEGKAKALAGYRGVGKSHFLATLGAIAANPELRSRISDQHVGASSQQLKRRSYPVAYVRRGTQPTLLDELRFGISNCLGLEESEIPNDVEYLISFVAEKAGDLPFIFIIDTAFERDARVARDDGVLLGKLAAAAKSYNVFIGVALDDDITEADGINSAIAQNFTIDYLDQEHLYQIINTNIFPKHRQTQSIIRQIYSEFRTIFPGFRWSEERFNSLYPLHPAILEVAPFVRLYVPDFAVLGFASEAGQKILGRPANSLIALDEVFDNVENALRKSPDLQEVFETFDKINKEIISQVPVMQRLQAKLILKAWFILSLDGDGTTAGEVAAAMLIFDEREPQKSVENVRDLLEIFAEAVPNGIWRKDLEGRETRYSFKLTKKDSFNDKLNEAVKTVSENVFPNLLRRVAKEKFTDWHFSAENDTEIIDWADCQIVWRGGIRRARLWWNWENENSQILQSSEHSNLFDLEIFINNSSENNISEQNIDNISKAVWQTAQLRTDEKETLKKLYVLLNDQHLRDENPEQVSAAVHTHLVAVEKIRDRIFLNDAKLLIGEFDFNFSNGTREKNSLSEMFSEILEPHFEKNYPNHPIFTKPLLMNEVSKLVNDLFSGARINHENVQELAETFALPLGLVTKREENYVLTSEETLFDLPLAEKIFSLTAQSSDGKISLDTIYNSLKEPPFGIVREAQHLILGALVAQRKFDFITSKGDRINRRSLDLKILWDDIDGIAEISEVQFDDKKLIKWAKLFTNNKEIQSIDDPEVKAELNKWLENWRSLDILKRFSQLPDEILNTKVWYFSADIEKTFGTAAETIEAILNESISIEEGLNRIADAFYDSETEFQTHSGKMIVLKHFIQGADLREKIWAYLAVCESTNNEEIEDFRERLFYLINKGANSPNAEENLEIQELWQNFHTAYSEHFAVKHDTIMKSHHLQEKFDEVFKSDKWWEFENLSKFPIFQPHYWRESQKILKQFMELDCSFDVRKNLKSHPFCACSFNLAKINEWENLPKTLFSIIDAGRKSYRRTLIMLSDILIQSIESDKENRQNKEFAEASDELINLFSRKTEIKLFSMNQLIILNKVLENMPSSPYLEINMPNMEGLQSSNELRAKLNLWLEELPKEPVLLKV
ncbi:MAG: DUF6079 family protein [Aridibacter sp.]